MSDLDKRCGKIAKTFAQDFRAYLGWDLEAIDTQELAVRAEVMLAEALHEEQRRVYEEISTRYPCGVNGIKILEWCHQQAQKEAP